MCFEAFFDVLSISALGLSHQRAHKLGEVHLGLVERVIDAGEEGDLALGVGVLVVAPPQGEASPVIAERAEDEGAGAGQTGGAQHTASYDAARVVLLMMGY